MLRPFCFVGAAMDWEPCDTGDEWSSMSEQENALGKAASAYLRSARHQPIEWNEWGAEAFAKAKLENKPVLLDIGAVWCHWCHVMDRESYENPATAAIINEHFVAVKVDRDERPGCGHALPGGGVGDQRTGRLAADGVSYAGGQAVLWRNVLSSRRALWPAELSARAADDGRCVCEQARRGGGVGGQRDAGHRAQ